MVTPTADSSDSQDPNAVRQNPNVTLSEEQPQLPPPSPPQQQLERNSQPAKTLTLETPNPQNSNLQSQERLEEDQNQDDVLLTSPTSQPILNHQVSSNTIHTTYSRRYVNRKKLAQQKKREKKSQERLEVLRETLKPIPFVPYKKPLDFSCYESLLRRLGLWDFVHLELDTDIRTDLIAQLMASYQDRCSYVKGVRIGVNRADLGRALKFPKKDRINATVSDGSAENPEKDSEESIRIVEEIVSNWMLLHDDTWMMPEEVLKTMKMIKEGNFEKVDWPGLIWFMMEKELLADPLLGHCYYASHMQCLIKCQKKELFLREDFKGHVEEDCDGDVKMSDGLDDVKRSELEEHKIELSLGQENVVNLKDSVETGLKENIEIDFKENVPSALKENVASALKENDQDSFKNNVNEEEKEFVEDEAVTHFEESKNEEQQGQWLSDEKNSVREDEHLLQRCTFDEVKSMDCDGEGKKQEVGEEGEEEGREEEEEGEGEGEEELEEELEEEEEEEEEEEQQQEGGFSPSTAGETLGMVTSANLIQGMEATEVPFRSGLHIFDDGLPGEFLASRADTNAIPGGSSCHFGNGNKREMVHDNELSHHSLNGGNKRLRTLGSWDTKSSSEYHIVMEQVQQLTGKLKMLYEAKEQSCEEAGMNQQILLNELQKRDTMIELLHKAKYEVEQKTQAEFYRFERELYFMGNLLEAYKKTLKETRKAFAEYRARSPQPDEPLYKDVAGGGGLVLSAMELEKQRLKQEEEFRMNRLLIEKKLKDFEGGWIAKFEAHKDRVQLLLDRLLGVENEVKHLKELLAKQKVTETSECATNDLSGQ